MPPPAALPVGLRPPSRAAGGNSGGKPCTSAFPYKASKRLALDSYIRYYDYTFDNSRTKRMSFKLGAVYRLNKWSSLNAGYIRIQNVDMSPEDSAKANRVYLGVNITL